MLKNKSFKSAFTLVELLVTLAVSSIIIGATFASYQMVANQYNKNMDIADMHTSGRAIIQIIERDVRMAGFVFLDASAVNTYGAIAKPLVITDSGNSCCDKVVLIYDSIDAQSKKVERIRITYSTAAHVGTKGTRNRLYKQIDILGKDNVVLATPTLGSKDVMADFVEDFQIVNVINDPYMYKGYIHSDIVQIIDTTKKTIVGSIPFGPAHALSSSPDGLLFIANPGKEVIYIYDTIKKTLVDTIDSGGVSAVAFGLENRLYMNQFGSDTIKIYDTKTKAFTGSIASGAVSALAFGADGMLYMGKDGGLANNVRIYDTSAAAFVDSVWTMRVSALAVDKDGLLYMGDDDGDDSSNQVRIHNPSTDITKKFADGGCASTLTFGNDGLLYKGCDANANVKILDPKTEKMVGSIATGKINSLTFMKQKLGKEELITINLTLRSKNPYGNSDKNFKKKDYHKGDFELDVTDKYKRDTFSSTIFARNMVL